MIANKNADIQLIVLAAGKGTRMESELPKVLIPLHGRPMISHLLEHVTSVGFKKTPVIIVGYEADLVANTLGHGYQFVKQEEQRGTGHAVKCAKSLLEKDGGHVMVLYGDHPFVDAHTINLLAEKHLSENSPLTMTTVSVPDFSEWRGTFHRYGRIVRNGGGRINRIVEYKDASDNELLITEVNPSYFCFDSAWLWKHIDMIGSDNNQNEFYLTDLVGIATKSGVEIADVVIPAHTALGANTKEELATLELLMTAQH